MQKVDHVAHCLLKAAPFVEDIFKLIQQLAQGAGDVRVAVDPLGKAATSSGEKVAV